MANSGEKLLYFMIGGFVGASVALLFAPKSGQETRDLLGDRYRTGVDDVKRKVHTGREYVSGVKQDLGEKLTSTVEKGRELVDRQRDQISSAIDAGKKAYQVEKEKLEPESGANS
jgi:gas vesicle protein